ncbi:DUF6929 family protein [Pontibacter sp. MBLB2868]|uniref:DUF6929 family protein n=1 Tax=Pontibacter sp. MBLB2868 TaxID=3451555 RepID=UPI003F754C77
MRHLKLFILLGFVTLITACNSEKPIAAASDRPAMSHRMDNMKLTASTLQKKYYSNLPSASGLEIAQGFYYVLGDDTPYLYQLDAQFNVMQKYALFDTSSFVNGRIPKATKPDLESMTYFKYGRDEMLLLMGSGASKARNKGYLVNLSENVAVKELDLTRFYTFLKQVLKIETEGVLNLEGLAMDNVYTYLMQRPLATGVNVLFRFDTNAFKDFILTGKDIPAVAVYHFNFPGLGNRIAGFSGAYALDGKLFFTASVEDTPNALDDGEVLGSFIGVIDLRSLPYATDPANPLQVPVVQLKNVDGSFYTGKAESLVVKKMDADGKYSVIVVSDDDKGGSELLEVELAVEEPLQQ